ncbi:hypothetical protein CEUSTIGMA_g5964.t1 [Chlamydomonas eustigma]|uniref:F-box domain-containing protein n=1 Tax=Chlamydomonas eustigma TaxID=1157962 RepID=A0A250X609_9CHLO|nr:hypothetical protein CEUSTIGMA_g5964.t1 [Chlamydomonas eustigma]|eukprot:GAX78524.1 hypothetical protein CEUSTIGMA_g5964.t1 [Chlamydomonas eustigma]
MKIRIKLQNEPADTYKLECSAADSLEALKSVMVESIPKLKQITSDLSAISLSLNKKDVLSGEGKCSLSSLGICGGDLIWVLSDMSTTTPKSTYASTTDPEACGSKRLRATDDVKHTTAEADQAAGVSSSTCGDKTQISPITDLHMPQASGRMMMTDEQNSSRLNSFPQSSSATMQCKAQSPPGSIMFSASSPNAALAATQSSDVSPSVSETESLDNAPDCMFNTNLHILPVHLKRLIQASSIEHNGILGGQAPRMKGLMHQLNPHNLILLALHAAMLETGFLTLGNEDLVQSQGTGSSGTSHTSSHTSHTYYWPFEQNTSLLPSARILTHSIGPFLSIHATLLSTQQPTPLIRTSSRATIQTIHLNTTQYVSIGPRVDPAKNYHVQSETLASIQDAALSQPSCFKALPELWRKLKDGVALWLLSRTFQEAGLPSPVSLLVLPLEVKDKILGLLKARDLAATSAVCGELRSLSRSEIFWQALYAEEFSCVPRGEADSDVSRYGGWAAAFAARWRQRQERSKVDSSNNHLRPRMPSSGVFRSPYGGGYPSPPPPGYLPGSFIIGGDYDRFPSQGQGIFGPSSMFLQPPGGRAYMGGNGYLGQGGLQPSFQSSGSGNGSRGGASHQMMMGHHNSLRFS